MGEHAPRPRRRLVIYTERSFFGIEHRILIRITAILVICVLGALLWGVIYVIGLSGKVNNYAHRTRELQSQGHAQRIKEDARQRAEIATLAQNNRQLACFTVDYFVSHGFGKSPFIVSLDRHYDCPAAPAPGSGVKSGAGSGTAPAGVTQTAPGSSVSRSASSTTPPPGSSSTPVGEGPPPLVSPSPTPTPEPSSSPPRPPGHSHSPSPTPSPTSTTPGVLCRILGILGLCSSP